MFLLPAPVTSCTFENGLCNWVQDQTDNFDWTRQKGRTSSSNTGPSFDHTTMSSNGKNNKTN